MLDKTSQNQQWKSDQQLLQYFMKFIEECLKFMIMGFFKRCRIITQILVNIKDKCTPDTKDAIFSEALSHHLKWCFITIQTCIKKGDEDREIHFEDEFEQEGTRRSQQVLQKLAVFRTITDSIVSSLDPFVSKSQQSNSKYYKKTLTNLLDKLFHPEDDEDDLNDERRDVDKMGSNQKSLLNSMKREIAKRDPTYTEVD